MRLSILDGDKDNLRKFEDALKYLAKDRDLEVRNIAVNVRDELLREDFANKLKEAAKQDLIRITNENHKAENFNEQEDDDDEELKSNEIDLILKVLLN